MTELHTKRTFNDITLVFVGIFALAGGLLVFRSFASKLIATDQPGTYSLTSLQADKNVSNFNVDMNANLRYCLVNKVSTQPFTYTVRFLSGREDITQLVSREDVALHKACFTTTNNRPGLEMRVTEKIDPSAVDLVVSAK